MDDLSIHVIEAFIKRWAGSGGAERANYQIFLTELCSVLGVPCPEPARAEIERNAYVFEKTVLFTHPDGSETRRYIDLYKRGCFVLEAKQGVEAEEAGEALSEATAKRRRLRRKGHGRRGSGRWDDVMLRARGQAEAYVRALPGYEGRPPFIVVVDVGHVIELYSEFSQTGGTYVPFPDPRSHRIHLHDLIRPEIRARLRAVWTDPLALDPSRHAARATREIAAKLARLAQSLEGSGHGPESVAGFLMRCLFTMFAEDTGLLPKRSFTELLASVREQPGHFVALVGELWQAMNSGGFSAAIRADLLRFNGGLFATQEVLPLNRDQIELLIEAGGADWTQVEPAIFGTLLERALSPGERHKLGAHYTPRAYVERLVLPAIIEPLREEWAAAQAAALTLQDDGKDKAAIKQIQAFHYRLCNLRVLDPACGSGNFLYVTLEHLKRLEGEVLNTLEDLGDIQGRLDMAGVSVDPHQFLGLEVNPRAAAITEMVLWIGYLQWHFRTRGNVLPDQPVIKDFHNIECRDAVLDYDRWEYVTDERGVPVSRWDGRSCKTHPATGEQVPDESARAPVERYLNPRQAQWPEADYVVGNPPFIGASSMRRALGDGYVDALRAAWKDAVPDSADFVMYWWHMAAELARSGKLRRFGFITTNSIRQTFNRRVLSAHMNHNNPLSLVFAIPDHPWVDSADGAAVRIAMTVGAAGEREGVLQSLRAEQDSGDDTRRVELTSRRGKLHPDLTVGANVAGSKPLLANAGISSPGVKLHGAGFIVTPEEAKKLGLGTVAGLDQHIRRYRNGRDLTQYPRGVMVIDLFGLEAEEVRRRFPAVYQWVQERVKPERDQNRRASYRDNWWLFGEPRRDWRRMSEGLARSIATVETTKHRVFVFLDADILPDNMLVNIAIKDAFHLGVLSSRIHVAWALATGGRLGMGNDPPLQQDPLLRNLPLPRCGRSPILPYPRTGRGSGRPPQAPASRP